MVLRVTAIVEDRAGPAGGIAPEHGLALLVETSGRKLLFDTGASGIVVRNAEALGLGDALRSIDVIVLSHGHYDHSGGLTEVLRYRGKKTQVFIGRKFFGRKVSNRGGDLASIGVPVGRGDLENLGADFVLTREADEPLPGLVVTGEIERREAWEGTDASLCIERPGGGAVPDPFDDERALVARTRKGLVVFSGCAHRGLVNTVAAARRCAGEEKVRAVFGGAHLHSASDERIERTIEALRAIEPEIVALGHCTGGRAEELFGKAFGGRFQALRAGASWTLE